jgi:hypothetical protein
MSKRKYKNLVRILSLKVFKKCGITAYHDENLHSALRQMIEKSQTFKRTS